MSTVNPKLLLVDDTNARYDFVISNHETLIKVMNSLTPEQHDQSTWAEDNSRSACGTSACALGWAALSEELPGLSWYKFNLRDGGSTYLPKVNEGYLGEHPADDEMVWAALGRGYFGEETHHTIFSHGGHTRARVIKLLEHRLAVLRAERALPDRRRRRNV